MHFGMLVIYTLISMAVVMDCMYFKISNWLNLCGAILAFSFCVIFRLDESKLALASGFLVPIVIFYPVYAIGGIGAGDVKLLSVLGGIMGTDAIIRFIVICFVVAGVVGVQKIMKHAYEGLIKKEKNVKCFTRIHFSYVIFVAGILGPISNYIFRFSEGGFC